MNAAAAAGELAVKVAHLKDAAGQILKDPWAWVVLASAGYLFGRLAVG